MRVPHIKTIAHIAVYTSSWCRVSLCALARTHTTKTNIHFQNIVCIGTIYKHTHFNTPNGTIYYAVWLFLRRTNDTNILDNWEKKYTFWRSSYLIFGYDFNLNLKMTPTATSTIYQTNMRLSFSFQENIKSCARSGHQVTREFD